MVLDQEEYNKAKEKIKARVQRWPSAYASGLVVQEYKRAMTAKGLPPYNSSLSPVQEKAARKGSPLARWFSEKWIDIKTEKPCGVVRTETYYPTCRPSVRVSSQTPVTASELTPRQKTGMVRQKQGAKEATVHYKQTRRPHSI